MQENKLAYARFLLLIGTIWPFLVWLIFRYTVPFFHPSTTSKGVWKDVFCAFGHG